MRQKGRACRSHAAIALSDGAQAGIVGIFVLILILVVAVAGGAYYLGRVSTKPQVTETNQATTTTPTPDLYREPNGSAATANWKIYIDNETEIQFQYPNSFEVHKSGAKDDFSVGSYSVGKYVDPNLPGVPSLDRVDIQIQSQGSNFLADERKVLFNLEIGEKGDMAPINTKQFGKGWVFTRLPDVQVDGIWAKSFISNGLWQAPSGSLERRIYVQKRDNIYMIRGYLVGGDINENVLNNLIKTFKFTSQ